jgi:hypothetical protein
MQERSRPAALSCVDRPLKIELGADCYLRARLSSGAVIGLNGRPSTLGGGVAKSCVLVWPPDAPQSLNVPAGDRAVSHGDVLLLLLG